MQNIHTETSPAEGIYTESQFRALIENSNDAIVLRDKHFAFLYCSPASKKMLGWCDEERASEILADIIHHDDMDQISAKKEYVLNNPGVPVTMTYRIKHYNGYYIWCEGIMTNWLHDKRVNAIVSNVRDITERKKTEQQLADSERRYRTLFQQNLSGVFQATTGGKILACNQAFADMLGYGSPQKVLKVNAAVFYFGNRFWEKFIHHLRKHNKLYNYEVVLKKKDGSALYVMENISLFTDPETGEEICDGVLIDITEKKKAEEAAMIINNKIYDQQKVLLELNSLKTGLSFTEKIKVILKEDARILGIERVSIWLYNMEKTSISSEYIYSLDSDQYLPGTSFNKKEYPAFFEMLSANSEIIAEDITENVFDSTFVNSYLLPLGISSVAYIPIRKGEEISGFIFHEHVGANRKWLYTDNIFIRSVTDIVSIKMSREESRRTLEALHSSEVRYRQIVETAQEGIWMTDENEFIVFVNNKLCELLGYNQEEMLGKPLSFLKDECGHTLPRESLVKEEEHLIIEALDCTYTKKNGQVLWVNVSSNPLLNNNGLYRGSLGMITDISKRKIDEALLQQSEALLAQKNEELEVRNRELEQFVYVASHDLQEPLRTVSGFTKLLQQQYVGKLDEKTEKYFNFILQGSERMKTLIKDLLDYSRIGKKDNLEKIDCNRIIADVIADLGAAIAESKAVIVKDNLSIITGYPTEIKQLFQNLIINAIKFRKPGTEPHINISVRAVNKSWEFSIKDNGIGMEQKNSERIFVIFQRLHTRTDYEGSGIGLAHCKKIVELHGGKIWMQSEPGEGTTFYFTINQ